MANVCRSLKQAQLPDFNLRSKGRRQDSASTRIRSSLIRILRYDLLPSSAIRVVQSISISNGKDRAGDSLISLRDIDIGLTTL